MSGWLLVERAGTRIALPLAQTAGVFENAGIHACPGLAAGWLGFFLAGGTLAPVYDGAPGREPGGLLVCAERDGFRVALVADRIERLDAPPENARPAEALLRELQPG